MVRIAREKHDWLERLVLQPLCGYHPIKGLTHSSSSWVICQHTGGGGVPLASQTSTRRRVDHASIDLDLLDNALIILHFLIKHPYNVSDDYADRRDAGGEPSSGPREGDLRGVTAD